MEERGRESFFQKCKENERKREMTRTGATNRRTLRKLLAQTIAISAISKECGQRAP
jgi:hypothetical protein